MPPAKTDCDAGVAVRVKGMVMVTDAVVLSDSSPLVPMMVNALGPPRAAFAAAQTCSVEEPAPVIEEGVNVPVTFAGSPVALSVTVLLKPLTSAPMVTE